ncbi:hypothetical protein GCM10009119_11020 [Algoriphagus jejuensis]|uniref:HTH luxR-type domain-containing protein n=1 Tax=Algoriphagus jejuensis TaxID=419934 RepID=A0ABN1MXK7_9BACT
MRLSNEKDGGIISEKIEKLQQVDRWLPGIKVIQRIDPEENLYLCHRGRERYRLSPAFFKHLPTADFRKLIFDAKDPHTCLIGTFGEKGEERSLYIRYSANDSPSEAELISVELIEKNAMGSPSLRVLQILPSNLLGWVPAKTARIVNEMVFSADHRKKYQLLTRRNREVLTLMVRGLSAEEIGQQLYISVNTVNTHKRKVREILEIKSNYELLQYGMAFDLV